MADEELHETDSNNQKDWQSETSDLVPHPAPLLTRPPAKTPSRTQRTLLPRKARLTA